MIGGFFKGVALTFVLLFAFVVYAMVKTGGHSEPMPWRKPPAEQVRR